MEDNNKERRELLLLKQNSEGYEDNVFRDAKEKYMRPLSRVENFFYYFKWILLIGGLAAVLVIFLVIQISSRDSEDMRVVLVSYDHSFTEYADSLKSAFEGKCPDVNGDGKVYVEIRSVNLTTRSLGSQYEIAESEKFTFESRRETSQIFISDEEFYGYGNKGSAEGENVFVDLSGEFPQELLYKNYGVRVSGLLPSLGFPDNLIIYVRSALSDFNNSQTAAECRERALEVIRSLKNGG